VSGRKLLFFKEKNNLDMHDTLNKDIYSISLGIGSGQQITYLNFLINPLVWRVWLGRYVLLFGTIISLWPAKA
jgi:cytochrome c biogenesis factor